MYKSTIRTVVLLGALAAAGSASAITLGDVQGMTPVVPSIGGPNALGSAVAANGSSLSVTDTTSTVGTTGN